MHLIVLYLELIILSRFISHMMLFFWFFRILYTAFIVSLKVTTNSFINDNNQRIYFFFFEIIRHILSQITVRGLSDTEEVEKK